MTTSKHEASPLYGLVRIRESGDETVSERIPPEPIRGREGLVRGTPSYHWTGPNQTGTKVYTYQIEVDGKVYEVDGTWIEAR